VWAIALGGGSRQGGAAFLARRFEGPTWRLTRPALLRRHGPRGRHARRVAMGARPLLDVHPTSRGHVFPEAGPLAWAGDQRDGSAGASIPGPHEAGAARPVRHPLWGREEWLAFPARASRRTWRAWGRGRRQRRLTRTLTDPGAVATAGAATPRGLAGASAGVPQQDAAPRRDPPYEPCQQPPGPGCGRRRPRAGPALPGWGAGPGPHTGEGPGPGGERPLDEHRHDHPVLAPPIRGSAVGRPHPLTRPALAEHLRARRRVSASAPARRTGPGGTPGASRHVSPGRASAPADQRRGDQTRGEADTGPGACHRTVRSSWATVRRPVVRRAASTHTRHR
jgi:hypothetical protein